MGKENTIGAIMKSLLGDELQRLAGKAGFYGIPLNVPEGQTWKSHDSLTIEKFLRQHPLPKSDEDMTTWGQAWETTYGIKPPEKIKDAREFLLFRSKNGLHISEEEKEWLKLITMDTDMF